MTRRFKIVFLDVGATLVDPHPSFHEVVARICRENGVQVDAADVERAEPAVWSQLRAREQRGELYGLTREEAARFWHDVYNMFMRELTDQEVLHLPQRLYQEFIKLETWKLYPDVL